MGGLIVTVERLLKVAVHSVDIKIDPRELWRCACWKAFRVKRSEMGPRFSAGKHYRGKSCVRGSDGTVLDQRQLRGVSWPAPRSINPTPRIGERRDGILAC